MTLEAAGTFAMWLVVLLRLPQVVRYREQRALWAAVALLALLTTLYVDAVQEALAHLFGAYAVYLGTHLVSVASAAAVLSFVLLANGYRRHLRWLYALAAITVTVLLVIYVRADPHDPRPGHAVELPLFYFLLVSGFSVIALTSCAVVCGLSSRRVDHPMMRWGLALLALGWVLNASPWLLNLVWLLTGDPDWIAWFSQIDGLSGLCLAVGSACPLVPTIVDQVRDLRAYLRLSALWRSLTEAVPDIVLAPSAHPLAPLRFRLYRRVIEIRDVMLVLRGYVDEADLFDGPGTGAEGTAHWLALAREHRAAGRAPQAQQENLLGPGGEDLDREIAFLLDVAEAYRSQTSTPGGVR
ncbi:hypothetical protein GCM10010174_46610 [Kutzneria viridogrisea]|uniref:DUF6545 domain-containing protein n=2 Tax=Kutzneria TaxID=43356 RepID=A0ABR6BIJ1_9PSEU|nr:MAB_1171c family putative transporter [Kutzneria albida]AHH95787.1 putative membrane protein [Kutzneria albida DSM 43870]MBA8926693.1 hypothetical protein [Kutzneria viridogrisea]